MLGVSGHALADCGTAPLASSSDMVISFLSSSGTQVAPASQLSSTVKEGMVLYDSADDQLKMCDGTNWISVGSGTGASGSGTAGHIQYSDGSGGLASDTNKFFWDATNDRLGVGTGTPNSVVQAVSGVSDFRFSMGASNITPTMAVINTSGGGKAAALLAGTSGSAFAFDSAGFFVISAEAKSDFVANTLGTGTTVFAIQPDGSVALGGAVSANASALLDVASTTKGFLPPRMTTTQVNAIGTPADGLLAYDVDTDTLKIRANGAWASLSTGGGAVGTAGHVQLSNGSGGFTYDNGKLFWDITNDRLGVGTNAPNAPLHVYNDVDGSSRMLFENPNAGTAAYAGIELKTNTGSAYIYKTSSNYGYSVANDLIFQQTGPGSIIYYLQSGEAMRANDTGIGIGTSDPKSLLHVGSAGYAQFSKGFAGAPTAGDCDAAAEVGRITFDASNNRWYACTSASGWVYASMGTSGASTAAAGSTGNIQFNAANVFAADSNLFWDDTNDRLGVGTATPAAKISIVTTGGANSGLTTKSTSAGSYATTDWLNDQNDLAQMVMTGSSFSNGIFNSRSASFGTDAPGGVNFGAYNAAGVIRFATGGFLGTDERMRIDATGDVGIGVTNPTEKLHLAGSVLIDQGNVTNKRALTITNVGPGSTGIAIGPLSVGDNTGNVINYSVANKSLSYAVYGNLGGAAYAAHNFYIDANAGTDFDSAFRIISAGPGADLFTTAQADGTEVFQIQYDGTVGVGTNAPDASSLVDMTSTTKGFLPPRMTTTEVNAIATPADGLIAYDTVTDTIKLHANGSWVDVIAGAGGVANGVAGRVQFSGGSGVLNSDAGLFWDNGNKSLGIGTNTPTAFVGNSKLTLVNAGAGVDTDFAGNGYARMFFRDTSASVGNKNYELLNYTGYFYISRIDDTNSTRTYRMAIAPDGKVAFGKAVPLEALDVVGNIKLGDASTGTVRADKELVLRQDGDTYGSSILRLRGRSGELGAIFETTDTTADLVDFILKSATQQRNIRMESRPGTALLGAPSFQFGDPNTPQFVIGDNSVGVRTKLLVGSFTPTASAIAQFDSTTGGLLPPRMTTTQVNAIATPADGLMAYDTDTDTLKIRANGVWVEVGSGSGATSSGTAGYVQISGGSGAFANSGTTAGQQFFWDNTNKRLGIGTATPGYPLDIRHSGYFAAHFQNIGANDQTSFYMENDRGSFASYGGFLYGGSTSTLGNIFGQTRVDKLFMIADGASNLGMFTGTLSAQPYVIGTNNLERVRVDSSGGVGVGTGASNAASALLQVDSTTRGFLPPRMTTTQVNAIATPTDGLLAYDTDTDTIKLRANGAWVSVGSGGAVSSGTAGHIQFSDGSNGFNSDSGKLFWDATNNRLGIGVAAPAYDLDVVGTIYVPQQTGMFKVGNYGTITETAGGWAYITGNAVRASLLANNQIQKTASDDGQFMRMRYDTGISFHTGITGAAGTAYADTINQRMIIDLAGNVGIGGTPSTSAILDVASTTKGFLPPRMTTSQVNAIATPGDGMMAYDTDTDTIKLRANGAWVSVGAGGAAASGTAGYVQISDGTGLSNSGATAGQQFFWDNTNKRLGIGNAAPTTALHVSEGSVLINRIPTNTTNLKTFLEFQQQYTGGVAFGTKASWEFGRSTVPTNTTAEGLLKLNMYAEGSPGSFALSSTPLTIYQDGTVEIAKYKNAVISTDMCANTNCLGDAASNPLILTRVLSPSKKFAENVAFQIDTYDTGSINAKTKLNIRLSEGGTSGTATDMTVMSMQSNGSVGIGTSTPDASALLHLSSTTQGLRLPNLTTTQVGAVATPGEGLMVYDTDTDTIKLRANGAWVSVGSGGGGGSASGAAGYIQISDGSSGFTTSGTTAGQQFFWDNTNKRLGIGTGTPLTSLHIQVANSKDGLRIVDTGSGKGIDIQGNTPAINFNSYWNGSASKAIGTGYTGQISLNNANGNLQFLMGTSVAADATTTLTAAMNIIPGGAVGIGTSTPNVSAALDVDSTVKGFLPPRLTTAQVTAVATPTDGLMVYDTDTDTIKLRANGIWISVGGSASGAGTTMISGWPDAIRCTSSSRGEFVLNLSTAPYTDGNYFYGEPGGGFADGVQIWYNASGNYVNKGSGIGTLSNCNVNIATLYSQGRAFNLVGGSGGSAGTGDVVGPASATDNAVARFDTTTGKLIQDSAVTIADTGDLTVTSTSASAFNVGANGATNPVFQVDANTGSVATGVKVTGAAAGSGVTLAAISSGTNEDLTLRGKGTGHVVLSVSGNAKLRLTNARSEFTPATDSTATNVRFSYAGAADTGLTASTEAPAVYFDIGQTRQHATGALALQRDFRITPSAHSFAAASALTRAAGLSVDGPPSAGTNATIGISTAIDVPTKALTASVTNAYGLTVVPSTGAVNNYAAYFGGSVGINTATPGYALDVVGVVRASDYQLTSDRNLKTDIETIKGLEIISRLHGVSFRWKEDGKESTGVIAQEVEAVLPSAVSTDAKGYKSVNYMALMGPMIEAVKELKAQNDNLMDENKALKLRLDAIEQKLGAQ